MMTWSLSTERNDFFVGQKVRTRGDMGRFNLTIVKIHNRHFCACKGYGKIRHLNMNCLEPINKEPKQ